MTPREHEPAAPPPEPESWHGDWATEESIPERPGTEAPPAAVDASNDDRSGDDWPAEDLPVGPERAIPDDDAQPSEDPAVAPAWLASAQGLVPQDAGSRDAATRAAAVPPSAAPANPDVDASSTRVRPRSAQPAAAWGWNEGDDVRPGAPATGRPVRLPAEPEPDDPWGRMRIYDPRAEAAASAVPARRRGVPWRRLLIAFVLGILLTAILAGGAIYAYDAQYDNRILPNVHVGSVDLSGMSSAQARQALADAYQGYGEGIVTVHIGDKTVTIPYADISRRPDIDAMVKGAFLVGRAPSPVERLLGELRTITKGVTLQPSLVLDAATLEQRITEIARSAEWQAVDANAVVTPTGFATTPSKTGQSVDAGTAAADVARQLTSIDAPSALDVTLATTTVPPAVSDASATAAVKQAALMNNAVVLSDGTDSWTIPKATVHGWLSFTIINNRVRTAIDTKAVLAELKPLSEKIDREARNATLKLKGTSIVFNKPSVDGQTFNASKTTTAVVNALRNRAQGSLAVDAEIPPVLALVKPALSTAQAKAAIPKMRAISSWTTPYQSSERNGNGANIRIPTSKINGFVVGPGETFSFWKAVGPVTKEGGYTQGGAIIDGHTEPQGAIGGGICSCSTTLFNAVLRAGYTMGDRLNHFYYINRYPLGLDATVFISASGQAQDMTWTNDTQYPVVIQGVNGSGTVKFVVYSVPNGRTTTFSKPIVKNYTKAHTETRVDKSIPRGSRKQIEYATDGQDVWVTRTVKDKAGALVHKETYFSHYATITGIILVNP